MQGAAEGKGKVQGEIVSAHLTDAEVEKVCSAFASATAALRSYKHAIRTTATQGDYDEIAIRKAVSFELAELIADERKIVLGWKS